MRSPQQISPQRRQRKYQTLWFSAAVGDGDTSDTQSKTSKGATLPRPATRGYDHLDIVFLMNQIQKQRDIVINEPARLEGASEWKVPSMGQIFWYLGYLCHLGAISETSRNGFFGICRFASDLNITVK